LLIKSVINNRNNPVFDGVVAMGIPKILQGSNQLRISIINSSYLMPQYWRLRNLSPLASMLALGIPESPVRPWCPPPAPACAVAPLQGATARPGGGLGCGEHRPRRPIGLLGSVFSRRLALSSAP